MRVIGAADERARLDVDESEIERNLFQATEFIGMVVPRHRRMLRRGTQVLPDRQYLAADAPQILERRCQLVELFSETDHQTGLGRNVRAITTRSIEQFERTRVTAAGTGHPV